MGEVICYVSKKIRYALIDNEMRTYMGKKEVLIQKIEHKFLYQVIVFIASMLVLICLYILVLYKVNQRFKITEYDGNPWVFQVDTIEEKDGQLIISGFAFESYKDADMEYDILLVNSETDNAVYPRMEYEVREDVNTYFGGENDYSLSGFIATVPLWKLDLEEVTYQILVRDVASNKKNAFPRGFYYVNHEMVFADPKTFSRPEVSDDDLLSVIVNNGVIRSYNAEYRTYVYQYEGDLYWIVERGFNFNKDGNWFVEYQMNTTQKDKLPAGRVNGLKELGLEWFWSNLGFVFTENECVGLNTERYRVAKCNIPVEYAVTDIWTGNYLSDDDWLWQEYFYPRYEFK